MKIGILFGGFSKEREISFAGGRTVYDNLNKSLFEAVPVFVDSFGNFVLLDWELVYKGSIRDFYPPVEKLPASQNGFQVYAESLGDLSSEKQEELIRTIGKIIPPSELSSLIDFAFLCLSLFSAFILRAKIVFVFNQLMVCLSLPFCILCAKFLYLHSLAVNLFLQSTILLANHFRPFGL